MTTFTAFLAPNARWQARDQTGEPLIDGKLETFENMTTTPLATYLDPEQKAENTNPIVFDGKGEANIYWADGVLYTIKLYDSDDNEIYTQDNYPVVGTNSIRIIEETESNIVRNPQFYFWDFSESKTITDISAAGSGAVSATYDYFCDDWIHIHENSSTKITLTQVPFAIDQTDVPSNPAFFLRAQTTIVGSSSYIYNYQYYNSVRTFSNETVTVSFYARSSTSSSLLVSFEQSFGSGGSPSSNTVTTIVEADLTTSWARYYGTVLCPSLAGKTLGTNGDDAVLLLFGYPADELSIIDIVNVQLSATDTNIDFPVIPVDTQAYQLQSKIIQGVFSSSDCKSTLKTTADSGWLMCNDGTIGKVGSNSTIQGTVLRYLYHLIWTNVSINFAPIYDSAGVLTTKGADSGSDFDALKRLALTKTLGRTIASAGTAALSSIFTADASTDEISVSVGSSYSMYLGVPIQVSSTGTLPAPLAISTTYYVTVVSGVLLKLSTTQKNCSEGIYINITTAGTGVHTLALNYSTSTLGQFGGQNEATLNIAMTAPHSHPGSTYAHQAGESGNGTGVSNIRGDLIGTTPVNVASEGGGEAHNNLPPTVYLNYMIKI